MISNEAAIAANTIAIEALGRCITRMERLKLGRPDDVQAWFEARIERTSHEIELLQRINGHLQAAVITVAPMSAETENRLKKLATALDKAIRDDAILNASIETTINIINAANELKTIIDKHS